MKHEREMARLRRRAQENVRRAVNVYRSQAELGRALGVTRSTVWHWLQTGVVPVEQWLKIHAATRGHVSVHDWVPVNLGQK